MKNRTFNVLLVLVVLHVAFSNAILHRRSVGSPHGFVPEDFSTELYMPVQVERPLILGVPMLEPKRWERDLIDVVVYAPNVDCTPADGACDGVNHNCCSGVCLNRMCLAEDTSGVYPKKD